MLGIAVAPVVAGAQAASDESAVSAAAIPVTFEWKTVVNNGDPVPGADRTFNSYNQPSVNTKGLVVFRARSKGGEGGQGGAGGEPIKGIYLRDMSSAGPLTKVFDNKTVVPQPNNTYYQSELGTFTEFPAFPRIGVRNDRIVTRGQSKPVWTYLLPDGSETRVGTSGIYTTLSGVPLTAVAQLGSAPGFEYFAVPDAPLGTRFDQFPGAPAVGHSAKVVFKGNYTDGVGKTGIFYRFLDPANAERKVRVIANSNTLIPGQPAGGVKFGSTAPPSASDDDAVFLGLDNEEAPTLGGIYRAPFENKPKLQTLVRFGRHVPGEPAGVTFNKLGEALSYEGRFLSFWGAWGDQTRDVTLHCPEDGQAALIQFCKDKYPNGHTVQVPVNQGIFVYDAVLQTLRVVAKTGAEYQDFLYWVFSGRPPGVGDADSEDFEEPRWRSSAFSAVYRQGSTKAAQVIFKGRKATPTVTDGIYFTVVPRSPQVIRALVETGASAALLDPEAPAGAVVTALGIERDGLRNRWLTLTASMLNAVTGESWAGIYVTRTGTY